MQRDRLEEKLRNSLSHYPSPMDLEEVWTKLERTRNQEKKRRVAWFWWLGGTVAVIGLLMITLPDLEDNQQVLAASQKADINATAAAKSENFKAAASQQRVDQAQVERIENGTVGLNQQQQQLPLAFSVSPGVENRNLPIHKSFKPAASLVAQLDKKSSPKTDSVAEVRPTVYTRGVIATERIQPFANLSSHLTVLQSETTETELKGLPFLQSLARRRGKYAGNWWIGFSTSVGIQERNLTVNTSRDMESELLQRRREEAETELEAYSFSFDIRKDFRPNWYFQTGIRHQIAFEHFEDQYERTFDKILEDQVTEIIQRADGTTTEIRGEVTVPVTESVLSSIYNTQNLTELPLLVGYRKALTPDIGLDLNLGIIYGIIQRKEGQVHSTAESIGEYESLSQLPYRNSNLLGGQVQGGITYHLNEKWQLLGGLQAKVYPNLAKSNAGFREQQMLINATIGVQFILGQ